MLRSIIILIIVGLWLSVTASLTPLKELTDDNGAWLADDTWDYGPDVGQDKTNVHEGTFWQITDIHWDQQYSEFGDASKMCHENYSSIEHNGIYGNYLCDSPWPLVKNAINTMAEINNKPDFILWTGDNVPHTNDPEPNFTVIFNTISNITGELRTTFQDSVPILPVLGNHDAFPKDYFPVAGEEFYGEYLTKGGWSSVLPKSAQLEFRQGGYYGYELPTGVTVLVLNTNLYYAPNALGVNASDPCGQFAWLRKRLQQVQDNNSMVIISAHAPPGYFERFAEEPFFNATYNDAYVDLLNEFGGIIMAQIYGHEHTDSFRLFQTAKGDTQSVAFIAPSVTPWYPAPVRGGTAVNPSLRLYFYNKTALLDYAQYHLNLTRANGPYSDNVYRDQDIFVLNNVSVKYTGLERPVWELYYQATEAYGLKSLDVVNMKNLYEQLQLDDDLFQKYYLRNSAGFNNGLCDVTCKKHHACAIANIKIKDLNKCMGYHHFQGYRGRFKPSKFHKEFPIFIKEDGFPVNFHSTSSSPLVIAIIVLSMSLTTVLAVILAVMLIAITIKRNKILRKERSLPVVDLTWGRRQQNYKQIP
ncbi:acid sphingomyelinase-like phosphodiesterase 3b [Procambarus clarkii]|uniref:acid sphingomyelinase-like phosphodiesterase 3b n=1 Tax=Procambarus clarkii TaxID=6728 RepID=UPI001E673D08|nr:acid sphingomyelinase-like phosphodiesterase 3b [Procambarus clarkii]